MKNVEIQIEGALKTYKFYTEDGKRLAIFAVPAADSTIDMMAENRVGYFSGLDVYMIECSEKDQFDRGIANIAFCLYLSAPAAYKTMSKLKVVKAGTLIAQKGKEKKEFINWCREKFCVQTFVNTVVRKKVLTKRNGVIVKKYPKTAKEYSLPPFIRNIKFKDYPKG